MSVRDDVPSPPSSERALRIFLSVLLEEDETESRHIADSDPDEQDFYHDFAFLSHPMRYPNSLPF